MERSTGRFEITKNNVENGLKQDESINQSINQSSKNSVFTTLNPLPNDTFYNCPN